MKTARRARGISRFEFAVVVTVVAVLVLPLAKALLYYEGIAERQRVDLTIRDMRTFLRLKMLDLMVNGRRAEIEALVGKNPVLLMEQEPKGYRGEFDRDHRQISGGEWYFDLSRKELAYVPTSLSFPKQPGEGEELRWQLKFASRTEMSVRLEAIAQNQP